MPIVDELLDAGEARLLHELDAHDRVLVEEAARVLAVRADPADDGGEVDDEVRPSPSRERTVDAVRRPKVVVATARDEDFLRPCRLESRHDSSYRGTRPRP